MLPSKASSQVSLQWSQAEFPGYFRVDLIKPDLFSAGFDDWKVTASADLPYKRAINC